MVAPRWPGGLVVTEVTERIWVVDLENQEQAGIPVPVVFASVFPVIRGAVAVGHPRIAPHVVETNGPYP